MSKENPFLPYFPLQLEKALDRLKSDDFDFNNGIERIFNDAQNLVRRWKSDKELSKNLGLRWIARNALKILARRAARNSDGAARLLHWVIDEGLRDYLAIVENGNEEISEVLMESYAMPGWVSDRREIRERSEEIARALKVGKKFPFARKETTRATGKGPSIYTADYALAYKIYEYVNLNKMEILISPGLLDLGEVHPLKMRMIRIPPINMKSLGEWQDLALDILRDATGGEMHHHTFFEGKQFRRLVESSRLTNALKNAFEDIARGAEFKSIN